jgi:Bax protein
MLEALRAGQPLRYLQRRQLKFWAQRYQIEFQADDLLASAEVLLLHLDQIPASMVLAQAAMESAWGTSRFVRGGYNFFGQWCYREGCGMVPSERPQGASHEVKTFDDPRQAVYAYFRNINSHPAYKQVRKIRAQARQAGEAPSGLAMIAGLQQYSQRGQAYINELRSVIRFNDLE